MIENNYLFYKCIKSEIIASLAIDNNHIMKGAEMISANNNISTFFNTPTIRLRVIRQALDIKQITFAKFMKISPVTLGRWEHEGFVFKHLQRERLRFVGINAQWLEYGTDNPFDYDIPIVREKILFLIKKENNNNKIMQK